MIVYRLGKTQYNYDLVGIGAKLYGARWNNIGSACLYTSESRALALLEYTVNINISDIPRALSMSGIEIPDEIEHDAGDAHRDDYNCEIPCDH